MKIAQWKTPPKPADNNWIVQEIAGLPQSIKEVGKQVYNILPQPAKNLIDANNAGAKAQQNLDQQVGISLQQRGYDPNQVQLGMFGADYKQLNQDQRNLLINNSIGAVGGLTGGVKASGPGKTAEDFIGRFDPRTAMVPQVRNLYAGQQALGYGGATKFSNLTDKKPRFEIDDSGAKLIGSKNINDENYKVLSEIVNSSDENLAWYKETAGFNGTLDEYKKQITKQLYDSKPPQVLSDLLDHPKLYKQYPELKNTNLTFNAMDSASASFNPEINTINISPKAIGNKSTLLHEIQHAIQQKEGFARGGSPVSATQFVRQQSGIEDVGKAISIKYYVDVAKKEFPNLSNDDLLLKADEIFKRDAGASDSLLGKVNEKVKNLIFNNDEKTLRDQYKKLNSPTASPFDNYYDNYNRLAGEVEARDVSSRMNLTPEQRLSTQPLSSQDIPLKDQIVRMDGGVSNSSKIRNELENVTQTSDGRSSFVIMNALKYEKPGSDGYNKLYKTLLDRDHQPGSDWAKQFFPDVESYNGDINQSVQQYKKIVPNQEQIKQYTEYAPEVVEGVKIPDVVYRGTKDGGQTAGTYTMGKGIYTSSSIKEAGKYGNVSKLGKESLPTKPLMFNSPTDFSGWLIRIARDFGYNKVSDFMKIYDGDVGNFIKTFGHDVAGVKIDGGYNFVKFP